MNKAKAYRELQRRQGRLFRGVWSEASSTSYDSAALKYGSGVNNICAALVNQNQPRDSMIEGSIQVSGY